MKTLSICIPTYNRKDCLRQCIDSIISQPVFLDLEIVVSDNASSDGTFEMMQVYTAKYSNIVYSRNKENIGFDKNMLKVVSLASGKYCLFIGDDDAFFPESLANVVELLEKEEASFYVTNNWGYDNTLAYPVTLSPNLSIKQNQIFDTLHQFILSLQPDRIRTVGFFGGMSGQIFLRELWDNYNEKEKFIGSQTIHLFILLNIMKQEKFELITKPTIMTRADNIRWDTFAMTNAWSREARTRDAFMYIASLYQIPYSKLALHSSSIISYGKNTAIFYIKKYILRDQRTILKIKTLLSKLKFT